MIRTTIDKKVNANLPSDAEIEEVIEESAIKLGLKNDLLVEVIFVDKIEICELNNKHRSINKPTDVLSFPQSQVKDSRLNIFGSIIICPEIAEERKESIVELIKHSLLHLCGYDHEENGDQEWQKMAKKIDAKL